MRIGEISRLTGFSKDTLRWYEKIGLIKLDKKARGENNYRQYDALTLARLLLIKQLKSLGFTLKETESLLWLEETEQMACESVGEILEHRLQAITTKIQELQNLKAKLESVKTRCKGNCREVLTEI